MAWILLLGLLLGFGAGTAQAEPVARTASVATESATVAAAVDAPPPQSPGLGKALVVESSLFDRLRSLLGLGVMLSIAWLMSTNRKKVSWRLVGVGVGLQVVLGIITRTPPGAWLFGQFNQVVTAMLGYTTQGAAFIFGDLARVGSTAYIAFGVLPTIIFFSSLMALLYHAGVMQKLVSAIAVVMQRTMKTSGAETLSAAGNIFVGQTEAPLLIRPFLEKMTQSELMAVMTGGFATVAGGVMIAYVGMLQGVFPDIAGHLLCASIMSAPAALVVAKIMVPETEVPDTYGHAKKLPKSTDENALDAAARGAAEGLQLALNVGAMLLAFIALVAMLNGILAGVCSVLGMEDPLTLEMLLGWLCAPLAYLMGVSWEDATAVGALLGVKTILNEFVAYLSLSQGAEALSPRSLVIATYALCGFANLGSIGIQLGGIAPIAPSRRPDLARLALRAMIGGTLAAFMTACVIGVIL